MSELRVKLAVLADAAKYDASCASSGSQRKAKPGGLGDTNKVGICHSYTPDGRCVSLLKILFTNHCVYDCQYCVNRISSDIPRARFTIDEVVYITVEFYKRNYIEGLFLSSGIIQSVDYTMQQLISVAKKLRTVENFNGYIHLKAVPGASADLLAEAGKWADRLSANIELPTQADLDRFAPEKKVADVEDTMTRLASGILESKVERRKSRAAPSFAPAGQSTQMIVGASPASDTTILSTATRLYDTHKLRRVYYSAFSPIPKADTRLPALAPPLIREHRLYQADWLMRFYGFAARELTTAAQSPTWTSKSTRNCHGRCAIGRFSRSTSIARRPSACCACPGLANEVSVGSFRPGVFDPSDSPTSENSAFRCPRSGLGLSLRITTRTCYS